MYMRPINFLIRWMLKHEPLRTTWWYVRQEETGHIAILFMYPKLEVRFHTSTLDFLAGRTDRPTLTDPI